MITGRFSPITFLELLLKNDIEGFQIYDLSSTHKSKGCISEDRSLFFIVFTYLSPVL